MPPELGLEGPGVQASRTRGGEDEAKGGDPGTAEDFMTGFLLLLICPAIKASEPLRDVVNM